MRISTSQRLIPPMVTTNTKCVIAIIVAVEGTASGCPNTMAMGRRATAPAMDCQKLACKMGRPAPWPRKKSVSLAKARYHDHLSTIN